MHGEVTMKKPEMIGGFEKYEIENAFDTLTRAQEILKDEKKVAAIRLYAKKKIAATQEVAEQLKLEKVVGDKLSDVFKGE